MKPLPERYTYVDQALILSSLVFGNSKMLHSNARGIPKSFQWYPDQSDQLSGARGMHETAQKCKRLHLAIPW